jgi:hypothetical protein
MTSTKSLEQAKNEVNDLLQHLSLEEVVHVLGYSLLEQGLSSIPDCPEEIQIHNIPEIINTHTKQHGQDLATALTQQGLVMLMWLNGKE